MPIIDKHINQMFDGRVIPPSTEYGAAARAILEHWGSQCSPSMAEIPLRRALVMAVLDHAEAVRILTRTIAGTADR